MRVSKFILPNLQLKIFNMLIYSHLDKHLKFNFCFKTSAKKP
jgi:hypothetical protein